MDIKNLIRESLKNYAAYEPGEQPTTDGWIKLNTNENEIKELSNWTKDNLGISVPLHFTAFYPCYERMDLPRTTEDEVKKARQTALDLGLKYVYAGNILDWESNSTFCPECKKLLIKRLGFHITENNLDKGKCKFCKEKIDGVWN